MKYDALIEQYLAGPKWDRNFSDLYAQVEQARAARASAPRRKERHAR